MIRGDYDFMDLVLKNIENFFEQSLNPALSFTLDGLTYFGVATILILKNNSNTFINGYSLQEEKIFSKDISNINKIISNDKYEHQFMNFL